MNPATNRFAGELYRFCGESICCIIPSFITTIRVPSVSASVWSCVTYIIVASPIDLYTKPCNVFVAGFIGSPQMNFVNCKAVKDGSDVKLEFGSYSVKIPEGKAEKVIEGGYIGKDVIMGIRPEDIKDEEIYINSGTDNVLDATVKVYEMLGAEVFLYFTVEGFDITVRVNPRTTARPGDTIKIALDVSKIHVFDKETEKVITN